MRPRPGFAPSAIESASWSHVPSTTFPSRCSKAGTRHFLARKAHFHGLHTANPGAYCALRPMSCVLEQSPFHEGETMLKVRLIIAAVALLVAGGAYAQSNEFATGNMHFDAKEMDTNGDHMITREEMIAYAEKSWDTMAQGKDTIPITAAAKDFASGGVNFKARAIDTD